MTSDAQKKALKRYWQKNKDKLSKKKLKVSRMRRNHELWRIKIAAKESNGEPTDRDTFFNHDCKEMKCYD